MKCQNKLKELCFIALQNTSANDDSEWIHIISLKGNILCHF